MTGSAPTDDINSLPVACTVWILTTLNFFHKRAFRRRYANIFGMDFVWPTPLPLPSPLRAAIRDNCRIDETEAAACILAAAEIPAETRERIADRARRLVANVRRERIGKGGIDAFLHEYALSSPEGVALLCLAEALLRVPDAETIDRLIRDKIAEPIGRAISGARNRSSSTPRPGR